ncbi:MAG: 3-hydroxyacyl-ACP dehydratase FabZ [Rhodospirillales bacterium]|nr:3-hydroxyacyl-ACP dehydratase FabZ [Rhodospirillales bacterium]
MNANDTSSPAKTIDAQRIMAMIPHRYPFLMIDRVIATTPGEQATAIKNVTINEPFFQGHFPGHPVMPGVLLIEAMAQTAAVLVVETLGAAAEGKLVYLISIDSARFRKPVTPGDTVTITVKKMQQRANVWKFSGEARVQDDLTTEAVFAAMIMDR